MDFKDLKPLDYDQAVIDRYVAEGLPRHEVEAASKIGEEQFKKVLNWLAEYAGSFDDDVKHLGGIMFIAAVADLMKDAMPMARLALALLKLKKRLDGNQQPQHDTVPEKE